MANRNICRNLFTLSAMSIGIALAVGASANDANQLLNPGAEADAGTACVSADADGVTSWELTGVGGVYYGEGQSAGFTLGGGAGSVSAKTGACFFTFREPGDPPFSQAGTTEWISQDVAVSGCSVDTGGGVLNGTFGASGWISTSDSQRDGGGVQPDDAGALTITFFDGADSQVGPTSDLSPLTGPGYDSEVDQLTDWVEFNTSGSVPASAASMNYKVSGTEIPDWSAINVSYDDLHFSTNCVSRWAKVSGRSGTTGKGKSNEPLWTFRGAVGELEDGTLVGSVEVNYKALGEVCTLTPTDGSTLDWSKPPSVSLEGWLNSCTGETTSRARIVDRSAEDQDNTGYYCLNEEGRGCFGINGPDPYRVSNQDVENNNAAIEKGNGIVFNP